MVLPLDHPLADRPAVAISDLEDERWVVPTPNAGCREGVVDACRACGFDPRLAIESDENTQMQAFVATGLGVAIFPRLGLTTRIRVWW